MKFWKAYFLAGAAGLFSLPAAAHSREADIRESAKTEVIADHAPAGAEEYETEKSAEDIARSQSERMKREMAKALEWTEEFFGLNKLPAVEEPRLLAARVTANSVMQRASLEKMFDNVYGRMLKYFSDDLGKMKPDMIAAAFGMVPEKAATVSEADLRRIAAIINPDMAQREARMHAAIRPVVDEVMTVLVPALHEGLSRAYARRFTVAELNEISLFFATPTGAAYASEVLPLQADPELIIAAVRSAPDLVDRLTILRPQIEAAFENAPPVRDPDDLSDSELRQIAKILKVDFRALKAHLNTRETATAADTAVETSATSYQAYDRENWSPEWLAHVEALETASQDAQSQLSDAETKAIEEASARLARGNAPE